MDCDQIRAPFSDNYCRDWLLYHGGIFAVGCIIAVIGYIVDSPIFFIGIVPAIAAPIAGIANYCGDRNFRK
jgi:hypothetical protein